MASGDRLTGAHTAAPFPDSPTHPAPARQTTACRFAHASWPMCAAGRASGENRGLTLIILLPPIILPIILRLLPDPDYYLVVYGNQQGAFESFSASAAKSQFKLGGKNCRVGYRIFAPPQPLGHVCNQ